MTPSVRSQQEHVEPHSHQLCPACRSANIHRSRARSWVELARKRSSLQRPFRCHDCEWRGWLVPLAEPQFDPPPGPGERLDLDAITDQARPGADPTGPDLALPGTFVTEMSLAATQDHVQADGETSVRARACPSCGSSILKRAPLPIVGPLVRPFTTKHRYHCRDCGWTGWKHRLHRRNSACVAPGRQNGVEPRAVWFFVAAVVFLVVVTVLLLRTWNESRPVEPPVGQADLMSYRGGEPC